MQGSRIMRAARRILQPFLVHGPVIGSVPCVEVISCSNDGVPVVGGRF